MPKNKLSLVLQVALSDRQSFPVLPNKKQAKRIYNKCLLKLKRKGYSGEILKNLMLEAIRKELFKIQPEYKQKRIENRPVEEEFFDRRPKFVIKGSDLWQEHSPEIDPIDELEKNYNETVTEGFQKVFCPRCRSNPCICRYEESYEGD